MHPKELVETVLETTRLLATRLPLLQPLAAAQGFDPIHFGIIMIANLEIGYLTPPVGLNLIVAMAAFKESFANICKAVVPFIAIMVAWLVIVATVPQLSLYLVGK